MTTPAKPTVAQLNELINQHAQVLHAVLARVAELESALKLATERIEKLETAPAKTAARPAFGAGKVVRFSGTFEDANKFARENCTQTPGICKTLVDGQYQFHVFFNK